MLDRHIKGGSDAKASTAVRSGRLVPVFEFWESRKRRGSSNAGPVVFPRAPSPTAVRREPGGFAAQAAVFAGSLGIMSVDVPAPAVTWAAEAGLQGWDSRIAPPD